MIDDNIECCDVIEPQELIIIRNFLLCYHKCRQLGLQPIFKHKHCSTHISHYYTKKIDACINKICSNSIYYECPEDKSKNLENIAVFMRSFLFLFIGVPS